VEVVKNRCITEEELTVLINIFVASVLELKMSKSAGR
jgi:hypothetical protein